MYALVVTYPDMIQGVDPPDVHGPFKTVEQAQAYAADFREEVGLPGPATPEANEEWTGRGWYFGIVPLRQADRLPPEIVST